MARQSEAVRMRAVLRLCRTLVRGIVTTSFVPLLCAGARLELGDQAFQRVSDGGAGLESLVGLFAQ